MFSNICILRNNIYRINIIIYKAHNFKNKNAIIGAVSTKKTPYICYTCRIHAEFKKCCVRRVHRFYFLFCLFVFKCT